MNKNYIKVIRESGAFVENDHIIYKDNKHGSFYLDKNIIYMDPILLNSLSVDLAKKFLNQEVDLVLSPAVGSVMISHIVSRFLSEKKLRKVGSIYADKDTTLSFKNLLKILAKKSKISYLINKYPIEDAYVLKRGYQQKIKGRKILVVDDNLDSGKTLKKILDLVIKNGGEVVGVGVLFDRSEKLPEFLEHVYYNNLLKLDLKLMSAKNCELCKCGMAVNTNVAQGKNFKFK